MHESVLAYVANNLDHHDLSDAAVLEVGSYNVNGSARDLLAFRAASYLGVDVAAGPGVDEVHDAEQLPDAWTDRFDVVVSTEVLEHCRRPWRIVSEMVRVCAPGGTVIVTARGFNERGAFPFHNPPDRWRLSIDAMRVLLEDAGALDVVVSADPQVPGVFAYARKPL